MAIKKYISPDVTFGTIRDNFRKTMGQYWVVNTSGDLEYNPDAKKIPDPGIGFTGGFADPAVLLIEPENSYESIRQLEVRRIENSLDIPHEEYGLARNALLGMAQLKLKVTGTAADYDSLGKFRDDLAFLFGNSEGFYHDRCFSYTVPDVDSYSSTSTYNYFVESYEALIPSVYETALPNHYNINIIDRTEDEFGLTLFPGGAGVLSSVPTTVTTYQENLDHALLYGKIDSSIITDDGLYEDSYTVPDIVLSGLSLAEYIDADLEATLNLKYTKYIEEWTKNYVELDSREAQEIEDRSKNIIISTLGTAVIEEDMNNILPVKDKMPFYSSVSFPSEEYKAGLDNILPAHTIDPIAKVISGNSLFSSFGSHIAGVYDSSYQDPNLGLNIDNEYAFSGMTFYDESGEETRLLVSSFLDVYETGLPTFSNTNAKYNSFTSALTYPFSVFSFLSNTPPSSAKSFDITNKLFIDYETYETNFARDLARIDDPTDPFVPNIAQYLAFKNYEMQTTRLSHDEPGLASLLGAGFEGGIVNQANFSFGYEDSTDIGRLYTGAFEDGQTAYNETVMYRIAKYRGTDTTAAPIQNMWIPNSKADLGGTSILAPYSVGSYGSNIEYIDTQVRYGQVYTYKVSAFKYLFGLKYQYKEHKAPGISVVETVLDESATVIGYIVKWTGMSNLFDDWEAATDSMAPNPGSSPAYPHHVYAELANPGVGSELEMANDYATYSDENIYYLSIVRLNEILKRSWTLSILPQGFPYVDPMRGDFLKVQDLLNPDYDTNASLQEFFSSNLTWEELTSPGPFPTTVIDRDMITESTPVNFTEGSADIDLATKMVDGEWNLGPNTKSKVKNFSVEGWLRLWFGAIEGEDYSHLNDLGARVKKMWCPPSGHVLPISSGILSTPVALVTGFENRYRTGNPTVGSVEAVEPGAGLTTVTTTGYEAEYNLNMYPTAEIVEVPYFTSTTSILSNPPPPPEISVIPYRGVNDTLLFSFIATDMEIIASPVIIEESEKNLFLHHSKAQGVNYGDPLLFKVDDIPSFFQVLRVDKAPSSYSDFSGKLQATISTLIPDSDEFIRSTSANYKEELQPNIKYYYTFRAVDFHGNLSNPTAVYEIELVDDGGAVYLLMQTYEFPIISDKVPSKTMKKFIEILPRLEQVTADVSQNFLDGVGNAAEDPDDPIDITLGSDSIADEDRIWDKKFKMRLTSKKTGKKIDFNMTFNKKDERGLT